MSDVADLLTLQPTTSPVKAAARNAQALLLKSKFIVMNGVGVAGLALAWINGWADMLLAEGRTGILVILFATFAVGSALSGWRLWKIATEIDLLKQGRGKVARITSERALELKLFARISHIRHIANAIMMMGLIGTVLGLIHALLSIKGTSIGDAAAASAVIGGLIAGMGTALYMSLAALILSLWLNCNFQLLRTATANLAADIIERSRR
jgi:hypothetical protein